MNNSFKFANCKKCGSLFGKAMRDICDKCAAAENELVDKIIRMVQIYPEPFIHLSKISEDAGVDLNELENLYKNGRFTRIANRITINCKGCGEEMRFNSNKGFFCEKCIDQMGGLPEKPSVNDPSSYGVKLRQFEKDIMHTKKNHSQEIKLKYGFKKSFD
jgi:hypothetical protein